MTKNKTIYISAGEASGDFLGASLAKTLLAQDPTLRLIGMGGDKMRAAGVSILCDAEKLSVMGFTEVLKKLPSILWTLHTIKSTLKKIKPDAIVCIDLPDTHFRFFKLAKKLHIPVFYYVSPQIWAWRYSRINTLKKYIQHMAVLFSFEKKIYDREKIPATFVGHPLAKTVKASMTREKSYDFFHLNPTKKVVSLFPGSRQSELENHLPLLLKSAEKIRAKAPDTQFMLMLAPHFDPSAITVPSHITITQGHLYDLLSITDAAIAVSGTITLEIGLMGVPLCVIYRCSPLSYWLAKKLIQTPYISLCNIVSEQSAAKELIQENATADAVTDEIMRLLSDETYHAEKTQMLSSIRSRIENTRGLTEFSREILFHHL